MDKQHSFVLPHEKSDKPFNSKEYLKNCDLIIAEVSKRSIGLGIELGWADSYNIPVACIYKKGFKPSNSLKAITQKFIEYTNSQELILETKKVIKIIN